MGKAAKFKKLRKLAAQLPIITTKAVIGRKVTGAELLKRGITEVNGRKVAEESNYTGWTEKRTVQVPLNHNKKMKQFYNKFGMEGVKGYVAAVIDTHENHKQ